MPTYLIARYLTSAAHKFGQPRHHYELLLDMPALLVHHQLQKLLFAGQKTFGRTALLVDYSHGKGATEIRVCREDEEYGLGDGGLQMLVVAE